MGAYLFNTNRNQNRQTTRSVSPLGAQFTYGEGNPTERIDILSYGSLYRLFPTLVYYGFRFHDVAEVVFDWKIHISLQEQINNVTEGWNRVLWPLITKYRIKDVKIVKPEALRGETSDGKTVTIYLAYNPELRIDQPEHYKLEQFLKEIEDGLRSRNIIPGPVPAGDAQITGSQYTYFRCERGKLIDPEDMVYQYISDQEALRMVRDGEATSASNPYSYPDIYGLTKMDIGAYPTCICRML